MHAQELEDTDLLTKLPAGDMIAMGSGLSIQQSQARCTRGRWWRWRSPAWHSWWHSWRTLRPPSNSRTWRSYAGPDWSSWVSLRKTGFIPPDWNSGYSLCFLIWGKAQMQWHWTSPQEGLWLWQWNHASGASSPCSLRRDVRHRALFWWIFPDSLWVQCCAIVPLGSSPHDIGRGEY